VLELNHCLVKLFLRIISFAARIGVAIVEVLCV